MTTSELRPSQKTWDQPHLAPLSATNSARAGTKRLRPINARILIVEDDADLVDVLRYNLEQAGFEVDIARDGAAALDSVHRRTPDLVILDLMLPRLDGLEVCQRLRSNPLSKDVLVIMLTAKSEESDEVVGFNAGADDYVSKPFSIRILLERIAALLRRRKSEDDSRDDVVASQGVVIDHRRHRVLAEGETLDLTPSEFGLLATLVRQPGRAFTRGELIDAALGSDTIVLDRTIDVHIRALRRKLGPHANLVQTVRGIGYRFREPGMA